MIAAGSIAAETHRFGVAWLLLCVALSLHVLDEALTGFLPGYNATVRAIRERFRFVPLPVFSLRVWLAGLCIAILAAFSMSPLAFRGSGFTVGVAYPLGVLMIGNALGHIGASVYRRRMMPGVYSSPLLLFASVYLLICAERIRNAA